VKSVARAFVRSRTRVARVYRAEPRTRERAMGQYSEAFVGFDVAKRKHAVPIAEGSQRGEVRFLGEIENSPATDLRRKRQQLL
jgi:hypothetical protein